MEVELISALILLFSCIHGFRLPREVQPIDYRLDIQPHFKEDNFSLYGQVWIVARVLNDTNNIILHCGHELQVVSLDVMHNETLESLEFPALQEAPSRNSLNCGVSRLRDDMLLVTACATLKAGHIYRLHIKYKGHLSSSLNGFYRSYYRDNISNETRWLASTVFEPNHARTAFPCFDEPGFKSHFQVNIASHRDNVALSNMPQSSTHNINGTDGWKWTRFHRTPIMSSYLVAFFVGKLESREIQTSNGTLFRVWARPEVLSQTKYALEIAPRILEYYNKLLGVREPLPKHDILALPRFIANALENWGLISFGEKYLLYEEGVSPDSKRQQVTFTLSHEFAHSWFGNLISLRWWDNIWLNEGFADYFATLGANYIQPEWDSSSVATVSAFLEVFSVDSLHTSQPLTIPLQKQSDLQQIFNTISYFKGNYLLRMLNHSLGESTFLAGCKRYILNNSYQAVDQQDLWNALTEQAHLHKVLPSHLHLADVMNTWTSQSGFPVINVVRNYTAGNAVASQKKFERPLEDVETRQKEMLWWIPITYTTEKNPTFYSTKPKMWMKPDDNEILLTELPGDQLWLLLNMQASGLYRVNYDHKNWELLSGYLNSEKYEEIAVINRALLLDDALNLARVGQLPYKLALNITKYLNRERHHLPWKSALRNMDYIMRMLRLTDALPKYKLYMKQLVAHQFTELGFEPHNNRSYINDLHQRNIVKWASQTGLEECVHKAKDIFKKWSEGSHFNFSRSMRSVVYCTAIQYGGPKQWNALWALYRNTTSSLERTTILVGLGCSQNEDILKSYLQWAIQSTPSDCITAFKAVASSDVGFAVAKDIFFSNMGNSRIIKKIGIFFLPDILEIIASRMNQPKHLQELEELEGKYSDKLQTFSSSMKQMKERVLYNIQWIENNYNDIYNWLQSIRP